MPATVAAEPSARHRVLPETANRMVRADLRKAETDTDRARKQALGRACEIARGALSLKEVAALLSRDERQIARWERGEETPQLDRYLAHESLWLRLLVELARLRTDVGVLVTTQITLRQIA